MCAVSVLFNEPKLLKLWWKIEEVPHQECFSALQRAEIAEMYDNRLVCKEVSKSFSALQRAEIAEMQQRRKRVRQRRQVSVLFNEPKLLKSHGNRAPPAPRPRFQCSSTSRNC